MTNEEHRAQVELKIVALKQEGDQLRNDLTRNMNALTLKVDIVASELREGQQQLTANVNQLAGTISQLTANVNQLTGTVSKLADFIREVAALQIAQDGRIRRIETLPPQTA